MKNIIYILSLILFAVGSSLVPTAAADAPETVKVEAQPASGFAYPYYLYVPKTMRAEAGKNKKNRTLLVIPNNTGKPDDDLSIHEADVKRKIAQNAKVADRLGVAVLMPVFPRSATDWKIYTHALDRDALLTGKKEFVRLDLQLVRMIDDARTRLKKEKLNFERRVLMTGFSASAMFVNRFAFLHPKRVKAAAVGAPGGWAMAPVASFGGKLLPYPIGTGDFETAAGGKFDLKSLRRVALLMFLGEADDNDSVVFRDGYEKTDEDLICALFGKTPVERWRVSEKLYRDNGLNAEFKLYPHVKHTVTKEMLDDILAFLSKHSE